MSKKTTNKAIAISEDAIRNADDLYDLFAAECQRAGLPWPWENNIEANYALTRLGYNREYIDKVLTSMGLGKGLRSKELPPGYGSVAFLIHRLDQPEYDRQISRMCERIQDIDSRDAFVKKMNELRTTDGRQRQYPLFTADLLLRLSLLPSVIPPPPPKPRLSVKEDPPEATIDGERFSLTRDQFNYLEQIVAANGKPEGLKSEQMRHPERIHRKLPQAIQNVIIVSNKGRAIDTSKVDV